MAIDVRTYWIDRGWDRIKEEIKKADRLVVKVGVQDDAGKRNVEEGKKKPVDNVLVAAVNEFGTRHAGRKHNIRIPERPFMRTTADQQKEENTRIAEKEYNLILDRKTTVEASLGRMGEHHRGKIVKTIDDWLYPPNALSTQLRKGRYLGKGIMVDNPLVDTGQMKQVMTWQITDRDTLRVSGEYIQISGM